MAPNPVPRGEREPLLRKSSHASRDAKDGDDDVPQQAPASELPPADRGKAAWLFLAACWAIEALVFSFGLSFGVFQDYYSSNAPFAGQPNIAAIGTTTTGLLYLGTPFVIILCRLIPHYTRRLPFVGLLLCALALLLSSFCDRVPQLVLTQGMMFGIGGCLAFCPCVLYIDEWFQKRKSLALGIMFSAGGFGGVVLPPILEVLLHRVSFPTALRILAVAFFVLSTPLAFFVKPRLPPRDAATPGVGVARFRFAFERMFVLHQITNIVQATGYFLPGIYLPTYARNVLGATKSESVLTLMLLNISTTVSQVVIGGMADRFHSTTCSSIVVVGTSVAVFVIWGLTNTLPFLYLFSVVYGLYAGGWPSIWPAIMREIAGRAQENGQDEVDTMMVYALLVMGRGAGNAVSGPLSDALIRGAPWQAQAVAGYGSGYGAMIVYVGVTSILSGSNVVLKQFGLL